MNIVDIALDFLEFILLLSGICAICFTLIIPVTKEINNLVYEVSFDKTVTGLKGEKPVNLEDGCLTAVEIAFMCCSQNSYLVTPVTIPNIEDLEEEIYWEDRLQRLVSSQRKCIVAIGNDKYSLTGRAQYSPTTYDEVYALIRKWCIANGKDIDKTRFKLMFSAETDEDCLDNVYRLYYLDSEGELQPCN